MEVPDQALPNVPLPTDSFVVTPPVSTFESNGRQTIADGTTVEMTSVRKTGDIISASLVFSNPTDSVKTIYPLKTAMHDSTYGYPPEPAYAPYDLPAGGSKTFKTTYTPEDSAQSVYWVYTDGAGAHYDLGSMTL